MLQRPGELLPSCHDSGTSSLVLTSLGYLGALCGQGAEGVPVWCREALQASHGKGKVEQPVLVQGPHGAGECLVPALAPALAGKSDCNWMALSG